MAGIYIHVPFCKQKCYYCNFYSQPSKDSKDLYLCALEREIVTRKEYLKGEKVQTIYFGGGTPSLLQPAEIDHILNLIKQNFNLVEQLEITLELNPDDVTKDYLQDVKSIGINRLSIGVQSFFDDDLKYLNRIHNSKQAMRVIDFAKSTGFKKLTIDLIYGIPTLTDEKWNKNLDIFFDFELNHLSAYALTVESKTLLHSLIIKGKMAQIDENQSIEHFKILIDRMEEQGFIHYEISNFAKPNHYSKHNSLYWLGANYLGLGPSAHSFNGNSRQWNVSNLTEYIKLAGKTEESFEKETLTISQRYDEYVMTSLRTSWGCDLEHIKNAFGQKFSDYCQNQSFKYLKNNQITQKNHVLFLTNAGKLFADGIAADLFWDEF